jgi:hypothetical protein
MRPVAPVLTALLGGLLLAVPAAASTFCGCNGEVALSFTSPPELTRVAEVAPAENGLIIVEVHAVLVDVAELEGPRGVFLDLGGFEMELRVSGAEPLAIAKEHLIPFRDFGGRPTQCVVGTSPGQPVTKGPLALVKWRVTFQGAVEDVRFDLDPAGLISCERTEGCEGSGASVMYVGTVEAGQENYIFAAGCLPAVLNPTGEPDLDPVPCVISHEDVGVYQPRQ